MKCTRKKMVNMYPTVIYSSSFFFFFFFLFSSFINCNGITCREVFLISIIRRLKFVSNWLASAHTARREEEPVHEDTFAIVIRIVGEQSVPFIFLLAATVTGTPIRLGFPGNRKLSRRKLFYILKWKLKDVKNILTSKLLGEWLVRNVACSRWHESFQHCCLPNRALLFLPWIRMHRF